MCALSLSLAARVFAAVGAYHISPHQSPLTTPAPARPPPAGACPIVDTWWQTETGGHMIVNLPAAWHEKPGSATLPFFGVKPVVVDDKGNELEGECEGMLCIKQARGRCTGGVGGGGGRVGKMGRGLPALLSCVRCAPTQHAQHAPPAPAALLRALLPPNPLPLQLCALG